MTRQEIQEEVLNHSDADLIVLEHCTGLGKSLSFIKLQDKLKPKRTLILVAEIAHIANWQDEYYKHGYEYLLDNTDIICYASLKNYVDVEYELAGMDESHHLSELRLDLLKSMSFKKLVLLSATITYEAILNIIVTLGWHNKTMYKSKITMKEAISWGILPKPKVYLIPMELDNLHPNQDIIISRGKGTQVVNCFYKDRWFYLKNKTQYPDLKLIMKVTEKEKLSYIEDQIEYYKKEYFKTRQERLKNTWLQKGSERKRFLGNLKTDNVRALLAKLPDNFRYICFCASIDQADLLGGDNVIHSKLKDNAEIISKFQNEEIDNIFCVGMLTEGQNLKNINGGIIVQLDGQERPFIQKSGRVYRSDDPIQFIFYYKDTRDQEYFNKIIEGIDDSYINVVEDINSFEL